MLILPKVSNHLVWSFILILLFNPFLKKYKLWNLIIAIRIWILTILNHQIKILYLPSLKRSFPFRNSGFCQGMFQLFHFAFIGQNKQCCNISLVRNLHHLARQLPVGVGFIKSISNHHVHFNWGLCIHLEIVLVSPLNIERIFPVGLKTKEKEWNWMFISVRIY